MKCAMTKADVLKRLEEIQNMADRGDHEAAHVIQDSLYEDVLVSIASGAPNPRGLAEIAAQARHINFARYCA